MSNFNSQSFDQEQHSDIIDDSDFENDDLITFQHNSTKFNLYYSQLIKYSKHVRETYLFLDVIDNFSHDIQQIQEELQVLPESVDLFFILLQQNYNINKDLTFTYIQCNDLLTIGQYFGVRKLKFIVEQYIQSRKIEVDFVIEMLEYGIKTRSGRDNSQIDISEDIENTLTKKINECLLNEKFKDLPIEIIFRILEKSSPNEINSNKLFDIIVKEVSKFYVLFQFLDLQKLSDDRLSELCEMYSKSNENTQHYFNYLKCNLNLINEMNNRKKNLEEVNDEQRNKMKELETHITSLQTQFNDSNNYNKEQRDKMNELETQITSLQTKFNDSEKFISQLQDQLNESQKKNKEMETLIQNRFNEELENQIKYSKELENQLTQLQEKIEEENNEANKKTPFEGQIVASVEKGLIINAEINLNIISGILDTKRSKVIISTSDAKRLGSEAYENGVPITSLHMQTSFAGRTGRYYVRCIAFNSDGESNEILSNSVVTTGSCLAFDYEGRKPTVLSLPQGQYMLEVWGAKGGDGKGEGWSNRDRGKHSSVPGGLGGYSRGILNLNNQETIYIFVGEQGCTSNSSEGLTTNGGFPDGGGTKTGIYNGCTTVPGTGGGSTSIRIKSDSEKARVIVAGGGGGASGCSHYVDPGGFGGGLSGGNCYFKGSLQSQGAGTQTDSSPGLGHGDNGDKGTFRSGANGKYKEGCNSGGGGGGGWFGGGGGGYGRSVWCSSGGGGSGWVFTKSSLETFQSGDSTNEFILTSEYYLRDAICIGGNEEFPRPDGKGNERGHAGHGFAKITVL